MGEFKKGEYIVVTESVFGYNGGKNYCYKLINNRDYFNESGRIPFEKGVKARYATPKEREAYDKAGKPIDVTTISEEVNFQKGKWYTNGNGSIVCAVKSSDDLYGYGINNQGKWSNHQNNFWADFYNPQPATQEEVEEALIKEAKKRGFKKGVKYYHIGDAPISKMTFQDSDWVYNCYSGDIRFGVDGCGWLFRNGKWAEIIENDNKKEEDMGIDIKEMERSMGKQVVSNGEYVNINDTCGTITINEGSAFIDFSTNQYPGLWGGIYSKANKAEYVLKRNKVANRKFDYTLPEYNRKHK